MYQRFQWSYSNIQFFHGFVPQNREQFKPKSEGNNSRALLSASSSFPTSVPTSHNNDAGHPQVPQTHHHLLPHFPNPYSKAGPESQFQNIKYLGDFRLFCPSGIKSIVTKI